MDEGKNICKKYFSLNHYLLHAIYDHLLHTIYDYLLHTIYDHLLQAMGMEDAGLTCGAVCVYPNRVAECVEALKRSNPKRRVRNWKHRFDPGTRRKTSRWQQWQLAFQVAKCLFPPGFRWLKLFFVNHLFYLLYFGLKLQLMNL